MIERILDFDRIFSQGLSVFLYGPRGVGKTSFIRNYLAQRSTQPALHYDLLKTETLKMLASRPEQFRAQVATCVASAESHDDKSAAIVVLDEIQLCPAILNDVHLLIETYPQMLRFILTGSSARKIKREQGNLLAGRAVPLFMHPFSQQEIELDLLKTLRFGSLPRPYLLPGQPIDFLNAYIDQYLRQEVKQESLVRKLDAFVLFLDLAAQLNGENINLSKLGRQIRVASSTIEQYYTILEDTLIVQRVMGWHSSQKKQLVTGPRFYMFDCGVINALRGELNLDVQPQSYRFGKLFESLIYQEMRRINDYGRHRLRMNYWRTSTGLEVDMILSRSAMQPLAAIEIKSSSDVDAGALNGLRGFKREYPGVQMYCICRCKHMYTLDDITFVPWNALHHIYEQL